MNIPESIVELVASESFGPDWGVAHAEDQKYHRDEVRRVLQSAAPRIDAQALDAFEAHLRKGLTDARNGGERHLHEDALIMLDAYRSAE